MLALFRGMPADGRGIEQDVGAAQAREARAFRIPLVPADEHADAPEARLEAREAQIARREIELLVVERVVGDVHLAVEAAQGAIGVQDRGGVVVDAGGAALEQRCDDHYAQIARHRAECARRGPGTGSARSKEVGVFFAAEILRAKELLQTNDLSAAPGGFADAHGCLRKILTRIGRATHLHESDADFFRHGTRSYHPFFFRKRRGARDNLFVFSFLMLDFAISIVSQKFPEGIPPSQLVTEETEWGRERLQREESCTIP